MVAAVIRRRGYKLETISKFWKTRKNGKKKKSFVPIHETTKKASKKREESLNRALESIQESLKNDSTDELLSLVKEDSER